MLLIIIYDGKIFFFLFNLKSHKQVFSLVKIYRKNICYITHVDRKSVEPRPTFYFGRLNKNVVFE